MVHRLACGSRIVVLCHRCRGSLTRVARLRFTLNAVSKSEIAPTRQNTNGSPPSPALNPHSIVDLPRQASGSSNEHTPVGCTKNTSLTTKPFAKLFNSQTRSNTSRAPLHQPFRHDDSTQSHGCRRCTNAYPPTLKPIPAVRWSVSTVQILMRSAMAWALPLRILWGSPLPSGPAAAVAVGQWHRTQTGRRCRN